MAMLFEIVQLLERSHDLHEAAAPILAMLAERQGMMHGAVALLNRNNGEVCIEAAHGLSSSQRELGRYQLGEGVTGKVVQSGAPAIVPRVTMEPLYLNRTGAVRQLRKSDISFLCVPLKYGAETIGALSVNRRYGEFDSLDDDMRLLSIIAAMLAPAARMRQCAMEERARWKEGQGALEELAERFRTANIIGRSPAMLDVFEGITRVSGNDAIVLIRGESGVGKAQIARAIHANGPRAGGPFVRVECAALPEPIIESNLFGRESGDLSGLRELRGKIEVAEGGTLFIDEIGDFTPALQVKVMRLLQEGEYEHVGGGEARSADVRVIVATRRNLEQLAAEEQFRPDLFYRLTVQPIYAPPLRERKSDIPLLADFFAEKYGKAYHRSIYRISTHAIDLMMTHHWPGNVRELENCIERAVLLCSDGVIQGSNLPPAFQSSKRETATSGGLQAALDNLERNYIIDALKASRGNQAKAAKTLGLTERVMGLRLRKHGIDPKRYRPGR